MSKAKTLAAIRAASKKHELVHIPEVAKKLRQTPESTTSDLIDLWRSGEIELRPEGGIGRLSSEDAIYCPKGPMGPLSYCRVLKKEKENNMAAKKKVAKKKVAKKKVAKKKVAKKKVAKKKVAKKKGRKKSRVVTLLEKLVSQSEKKAFCACPPH